MKTKPHVEKQRLGPHGEVTLPPDYLKELGLYPGESEVELHRAGQRMLIEPVTEAVAYKDKARKEAGKAGSLAQLSGILEIDDPDVEELITKEAWYD